jgi:hypothetical protein
VGPILFASAFIFRYCVENFVNVAEVGELGTLTNHRPIVEGRPSEFRQRSDGWTAPASPGRVGHRAGWPIIYRH